MFFNMVFRLSKYRALHITALPASRDYEKVGGVTVDMLRTSLRPMLDGVAVTCALDMSLRPG